MIKVTEHANLATLLYAAEQIIKHEYQDMQPSRKIYDKLVRADTLLARAKSNLEDVMFLDHPDLSNDYLRIYFNNDLPTIVNLLEHPVDFPIKQDWQILNVHVD